MKEGRAEQQRRNFILAFRNVHFVCDDAAAGVRYVCVCLQLKYKMIYIEWKRGVLIFNAFVVPSV